MVPAQRTGMGDCVPGNVCIGSGAENVSIKRSARAMALVEPRAQRHEIASRDFLRFIVVVLGLRFADDTEPRGPSPRVTESRHYKWRASPDAGEIKAICARSNTRGGRSGQRWTDLAEPQTK